MTSDNIRISRRSVLAGLGAIGVASAGAGLGTTAFFSDEEAVATSLRRAASTCSSIIARRTTRGSRPTRSTPAD